MRGNGSGVESERVRVRRGRRGGGSGGYEERGWRRGWRVRGGKGTQRAGTGRAGTGWDIYIYIHIPNDHIYINMVITRIKHGSPDMILTAFDMHFR